MVKVLKRLPLIALLLLLSAFAAERWLQYQFVKEGPAASITRVQVQPGASVRAVLAMLGQRGVLSEPRVVEAYLRVHRMHPRVKAGAYDIPRNASAASIIRQLEKGDVVLEQLTVVEGSRFAELRAALERHPGIVATLAGKSDTDVMLALGHPGQFPEGRFFPDTYRFAAKTSDVEVLRLAYASMEQVLAEAWRKRREGLVVRSPEEVLILASIVEKETGLAAERARIAGVFSARLRIGMRLQSDPTVIYGLGDRYDGDIRTRDLTADTPYNTYTRSGLPPTPIALPGRESVLAVTHPQDTGALYFVATGDGSGAHYFSKTLEEHNEAVKRYLARLRRQSGAAQQQIKSGEP